MLAKMLPDIPIEFYDERFTSVLAHRAMIDGGLGRKRRQDKALVRDLRYDHLTKLYGAPPSVLNGAEKSVAHVSALRSLYSTQFSCSYLFTFTDNPYCAKLRKI